MIHRCLACDVEGYEPSCFLCGQPTEKGTVPIQNSGGQGDYTGAYELDDYYARQYRISGGVM